MNKIYNNVIKNRRAFTMIETIVALVIITIGFGLIQLILIQLKAYPVKQGSSMNPNTYLRVLESEEYQFEVVKINHQELTLYSPKLGKEYRMFNKQQILRLTSEKGGYLPLLDQVSKINWHYQKPLLTTQLILDNGSSYTFTSLLHYNKRAD